MTDQPQTTVCPDCEGRGYTESLEGHHLVCTCFYAGQEGVEQTPERSHPADSFRHWLESELNYLKTIQRTEFGNGKLAAYQNALREYYQRG